MCILSTVSLLHRITGVTHERINGRVSVLNISVCESKVNGVWIGVYGKTLSRCNFPKSTDKSHN